MKEVKGESDAKEVMGGREGSELKEGSDVKEVKG